MRKFAAALALGLAVVAGAARADEPKKDEPAKDEPKKDDGYHTKYKDRPVPEDPDNIKGISPYEKQIAEGKRLAQMANWPAAAAAFQKAIDMKPDEARGYLLLSQAKREGDVLGVVEQGETKQGDDATMSRLMFVRAELLERRASLTPTSAATGDLSELLKTVWDKSLEAWKAYAAFVTAHTRAPDFTASAQSRIQAIDDRQKREQVFAAVRARKDNK